MDARYGLRGTTLNMYFLFAFDGDRLLCEAAFNVWNFLIWHPLVSVKS